MKTILPETERAGIIALMRREIVPATGCTEPVAVALACAYAARQTGMGSQRHPADFASITCRLSGNMIKNAMGVGIPGTGRTGLPIAIALGALRGNPDCGLEVLDGVSRDEVEAADALTKAEGIIDIGLQPGPCDKLYIDVSIRTADGRYGHAIIEGAHTHVVLLEGSADDECRMSDVGCRKDGSASETADGGADIQLTMRKVWNFAMTTPLDEIRFILEARRLNKAVAESAMHGDYGHSVGRTMHCLRQRQLMGDSIFTHILAYTSAACDARMGGAAVTVMSNSGSGNQGIAATVPVVVYADDIHADEEHTIRALTLSHLTAIYIKQSLGRLSALCGCVVAATGSSAGICYLMGGDYDRVVATIKNMVATLTGMICDGAKPSCALKLASGVSTAVVSALVAMEGHCVTPLEGIVDDSIDRTIANLTTIGRDAMNETDDTILRIMTSK